MSGQVLELEEKLHSQKLVIRGMQESLERKNKLLEAYWHVWCSGGCGAIGDGTAYLDEETLLVAEAAVKRMRVYYTNQEYHMEHNGDPYGAALKRRS